MDLRSEELGRVPRHPGAAALQLASDCFRRDRRGGYFPRTGKGATVRPV